MLLVCQFLAFTSLLYWCAAFSVPAATMLTAANITKPGCARKCGNVTIPYPFGIGTGCSMGYHYNVTCINSSIPSLYQEMFSVLDISETQVRLEQGFVASSCDNDDHHNKTPADYGLNNYYMKGYPYAFSDKDNMFIVIGCHHYGLLEVQTRVGRKAFSCVAVCTKKEDLHDGTCSGFGCCQVPITKGLENVIKTRIEKIYYEDANISSGNCSYAFIGDASGEFKIRRALDLQDPSFGVKAKKFPAVMEWFITNQTCSEARRNSSSNACQQNTRCIDLDQTLEVQGYRCQCCPGYEGNPYLSPGCTDINECEDPSNPCSDICRNTPGKYRCSCPRGYHGDGRRNGIGCLPNKTSRNVFALGFGIGLGSTLLILAGIWLSSAIRRRKVIIQRAKNFKRNGGLLLQQHMSSQQGIVEKTRIFLESELGKATDHFNEDRVLGEGGQGTVYKGMLSDGSIVAIKKSKIVNQSQLDQFINEVVLLSQINHRNIVKLLGCCLETEVPLLVYEFIPNGALSTHIHDPSVEFPITWEMRLQIATDVAGALTYLHSASSKPIFHRDIKTANILLDEKYRAKLSDFGTSRSIDINQTHLTTRVLGTLGYLDPEYFQSNHFTEKSDVYSFGVILVELLTGQKAILHTESFSGKR